MAALAGALAGCAGSSMDFFAAPEPGWEPRPMGPIAVVVLGEGEEARARITRALAREGRRRGARLLSLEELLSRLPGEGAVEGPEDANRPEVPGAEARDSGRADSAAVVRRDSAGTARYAAPARRAFREAGVKAVLEISLEAGGREVDPGIEHTVYDCDEWVESRGGMVCVRPREVAFRGDTLYRPWAHYRILLRDPESLRILWRGGAHTGAVYRRPAEMHDDLVEALVAGMSDDGILPGAAPGAAGGGAGG